MHYLKYVRDAILVIDVDSSHHVDRLWLSSALSDESAGLDRMLDVSRCTCRLCPSAFTGILLYINTIPTGHQGKSKGVDFFVMQEESRRVVSSTTFRLLC